MDVRKAVLTQLHVHESVSRVRAFEAHAIGTAVASPHRAVRDTGRMTDRAHLARVGDELPRELREQRPCVPHPGDAIEPHGNAVRRECSREDLALRDGRHAVVFSVHSHTETCRAFSATSAAFTA